MSLTDDERDFVSKALGGRVEVSSSGNVVARRSVMDEDTSRLSAVLKFFAHGVAVVFGVALPSVVALVFASFRARTGALFETPAGQGLRDPGAVSEIGQGFSDLGVEGYETLVLAYNASVPIIVCCLVAIAVTLGCYAGAYVVKTRKLRQKVEDIEQED